MRRVRASKFWMVVLHLSGGRGNSFSRWWNVPLRLSTQSKGSDVTVGNDVSADESVGLTDTYSAHVSITRVCVCVEEATVRRDAVLCFHGVRNQLCVALPWMQVNPLAAPAAVSVNQPQLQNPASGLGGKDAVTRCYPQQRNATCPRVPSWEPTFRYGRFPLWCLFFSTYHLHFSVKKPQYHENLWCIVLILTWAPLLVLPVQVWTYRWDWNL